MKKKKRASFALSSPTLTRFLPTMLRLNRSALRSLATHAKVNRFPGEPPKPVVLTKVPGQSHPSSPRRPRSPSLPAAPPKVPRVSPRAQLLVNSRTPGPTSSSQVSCPNLRLEVPATPLTRAWGHRLQQQDGFHRELPQGRRWEPVLGRVRADRVHPYWIQFSRLDRIGQDRKSLPFPLLPINGTY